MVDNVFVTMGNVQATLCSAVEKRRIFFLMLSFVFVFVFVQIGFGLSKNMGEKRDLWLVNFRPKYYLGFEEKEREPSFDVWQAGVWLLLFACRAGRSKNEKDGIRVKNDVLCVGEI